MNNYTGRRRRRLVTIPKFRSAGAVTDLGEQPIPAAFALLVQANTQGLENAVEGAIASPAIESAVDPFPFPTSFVQVTPWRPRTENPQHAVGRCAKVAPFSAAALFGNSPLVERRTRSQ
jgi:hypothetical protein